MNFLNYDSPFMTECRKAVNYVLLGLWWIMASIPVFTFGAATTAMYYTVEKCIRKDDGHLWGTFWKSFKREFKQGTLVWLIGFVLTVICAANSILLLRKALPTVFFALLLATVLFSVGWMQLWYGYLSRFEDKTRVLLGNTFRLALIHFPQLVLLILICAVAVAAAVIFFFYAPPVLFLIPGIYLALTDLIHCKIFKKYMPEEEKNKEQLPEGETADPV